MVTGDNRLIMICGLPGSGKTKLARQLEEELGGVRISSDDIREEINHDAGDQSNAELVFEVVESRMNAALAAGQTVIYDATNRTVRSRRRILRIAGEYNCLKQCIICATPLETCLERNASRNRVVAAGEIKRMYKTWSTPAYYEGWDEISILYADGVAGSAGGVEAYAAKYMDYSQDNPHHLETLGQHLLKVRDYLVERLGYPRDGNVAIAGLIHDCGKPYTRSFRDYDGNESEMAHYYDHQSVGAYDALFFDYGDLRPQDILEISVLVNLHMKPFDWVKAGTRRRYRSIWGDELYTHIMHIHEADQASSIHDINDSSV